MNNRKLTSVRLDPKIVDYCEKFCNNRNYWKKSDVINNLLLAVILNFTEQQIYDMMRSYSWCRKEVRTEFEIVEESFIKNKLL